MVLLALLSTADAKAPGWNLAPFGVGVYVHGKPARGVAYSVTQAAGIATLAYASAKGYDAAYVEDEEAFQRWQGVTIAGATVAVGSYLVSVLDGSRLHDLELEGANARDRVRAWDRARAVAVREP